MAKSPKVKIYCAAAMSGRMQDEMRCDADMLVRVLINHGFEPLSPVVEEHIPYVHEPLKQTSEEQLRRFWARDKEMLHDADILLDYMSCNKSDGVSNEIGLMRYGLWKPVVRVWPSAPKFNISQIEHDVIVESLADAIAVIKDRWGDYKKLGSWRKAMLDRCFGKWVGQHHEMNARYGVHV